MSINKVMITGNLTRDPEVRNTASGFSILSFSVAVNDRRKNPSSGEWEDYANFIDCTMFGARTDFFARNLTKGSKVAIEGKLRWSQWESKDGSGKRSKIEVVVDDMEIMSRNGNGGGNANNNGYVPQSAPAAPAMQSGSNYGTNNYGNSNNFGNSNNYSGGYSPAIASPAIDATSDIYDEDIPF